MLTDLIKWLVGCWSCETCSWFTLLVNVLSCLLRAGIVVLLIWAVSKYGSALIDAL